MVGLLLVTHPGIGQAMAETARTVLDESLPEMAVIEVPLNHRPEESRAPLIEAVHAMDSGAGVLVLTDLIGATPCNLARQLDSPGFAVVSGLNLPMLLKTLNYRSLPLAELAGKALSGGRNGVFAVCGDCAEEAR